MCICLASDTTSMDKNPHACYLVLRLWLWICSAYVLYGPRGRMLISSWVVMVVVIVPKIVNPKYVSTALGAHKSVSRTPSVQLSWSLPFRQLEQTGTTLFQTLVGLLLDTTSKNMSNSTAGQQALNIFLFLNCLHMLSIALLAFLQWRRGVACKDMVHEILQSGMNTEQPSTVQPTIPNQSLSSEHFDIPLQDNPISVLERRRGQIFAVAAAVLVIAAWVLFLGTAYDRMGRKLHWGMLMPGMERPDESCAQR